MKPLSSIRTDNSRRRRAGGFSMIEVLVALLVLLIGLLGVVRMQLLSVQNNQGAYLRTQATYIASDMLDRMRANRAGRNEDSGGAFIDRYEGFEFSALEDSANDVKVDTSCASADDGCTAEQVAAIDLMEVSSNFVDVYELGDGWVPTLPQGSISIEKTASGDNDEYVVTVGWQEQDWDTDDDGEAIRAGSVQRSVQLRSMIRRVALFGGGSAPDPNDP